MTTEFDKDKVLARVKKMMMLANDVGASEGERDNALRMAHSTLAKYNLSMAEADAAGQRSEEKRTGSPMEGRDYPWMRTCAFAIAKLMFCEYFYTSQRGGIVKHFFIGKESNVYTAQEMSKYVISSINREAKRMMREVGGNSGTYWRSFCKGAANRIYFRCEEIRKSAEATPAVPTAPGTALALVSVYASEKEANTKFLTEQMGMRNLRASRERERNTSYEAYHDGRVYGDKVSLNRQISQTKRNDPQLR